MSRAFMPWYIGDYLRDTGHLTTEQHGAYLLLLAHCWQHGAIPLDPAAQAAIARLSPRRWRDVKSRICPFFNADGTHKRVTLELARAAKVSMTRVLIGSKGAANTPAKSKQ